MTLQSLPEEIVLHLTKYLNGLDAIRLSHVCQRFLYILQNDHLWSTIANREGQAKEADICHFAKVQATSVKYSLLHYCAREKFSYMFHRCVAGNWKHCRYVYHTLPLSEKSKVGNDTRNLVRITTKTNVETKKKWAITVFDLRNHGFHPITVNRPLDIELKDEHKIFNLELGAILVARNTAVLCFKGIGDDTPEEMIAIDLTPGSGYKELWRDVTHDWGQFQLSRLFGREVYKIDLLNNNIVAHDIRTYDKLSTLQLVEEMRYPHGEIAGDGRHLAVPGKMSEDNSPAVCVWNVRRRTRKYLYPTSAFCPFRWFEKVAVSKGKVYGLLNRRCLFAWEAESGDALFKIDLCESYPGQNEELPSFSYLSVYNDNLATISQDPSCQIVYHVDALEDNFVLKVVMPQLNINWLKAVLGNKADIRICDVKMNDHCIIIHFLNLNNQHFEALIIRLEEKGPLDEKALVNNARGCCILMDSNGPNVPGQLVMTPSKLLNVTQHQVQMYDFLV